MGALYVLYCFGENSKENLTLSIYFYWRIGSPNIILGLSDWMIPAGNVQLGNSGEFLKDVGPMAVCLCEDEQPAPISSRRYESGDAVQVMSEC